MAQAYAQLRFGDAARDRLKRMEALAQKVPGHIEGALALARAAIDAQDYAKARAALAPHLAALTKRVALLMAELERAEHNDEGRAREWLSRAIHAAPDPEWTADGHVSDRWLPVSPVNGRLDAFEWRVPLTGIASRAGDRAGAAPRPRRSRPRLSRAARRPDAQTKRRATAEAVTSNPPAAEPARRPARARRRRRPSRSRKP